jgi:hypothetical protein
MSGRRRATEPSLVEEQKNFVSVTLTAVAAGNYTAGDIVSNDADDTEGDAIEIPLESFSIRNIRQIVAVCSEDSIVARLRLHFYDYNPAAADVEMDDNIAGDFAKNATGAAGYLGSVLMTAFVDRGTAMSVADAQYVDLLVRTKEGSTKIYMVAEFADAEANEAAGMTIRFDIYFD